MPTPFPGMDPYLERASRWHPFHIPLRRGEEEPTLDLNTVLHELYDRARFDLRIDYGQPPDPLLSFEDAEWAAVLLQQTADD